MINEFYSFVQHVATYAVKKAVASFATNFMDWIDIQLLFSLFIFSTSKMEKTT